MLLKCECSIVNREMPHLETRRCHTTFMLSKSKDNPPQVFFTLHTTKNKSGTKYMIKGNIEQVHRRFLGEGKCTLSMKEPQHNIIISKGNPSELKKFLLVLQLACRGEDLSATVNLDNAVPLRLVDLEKPKTEMTIAKRSDYPMKSTFPKTLESLGIHNCALKRFDSRLLKLKQLRKIDLSNNKLEELPSLDCLENLSHVNISANYFSTFPPVLLSDECCSRMSVLDVSYNKIKHLPRHISRLQKLITLNLSYNEINYLSGDFGSLSSLQYLNLVGNRIILYPWSFQNLRLVKFDVPTQDEENLPNLSSEEFEDVSSLFEITMRFFVKKRLSMEILPAFIRQNMESVKFCLCGSPCITNYAPYVRSFDVSSIANELSFEGNNMKIVNIVGYLCSKRCQLKWLQNPNTLFTSK